MPEPKGGYDSTPVKPSNGPTYTVRITFHRATNLPVADFGSGSADPFILAQVTTSHPPRHSQDPYLRWRSKTIRKSLEPVWESSWDIAGVPADGLNLSARIYDEDPQDHDDRLGKVEISTGSIDENWKGIKEETFKVKKTGADLRAYGARWICTMVNKNRKLHAQLTLSIEVLGKTPKDEDLGKAYTISSYWWIHFSPMIGRIAGVKAKNHQGVEKYNFQANEIQLRGPVPNELYHRYVEFKTFVGGMFESTGLRGKILNKALHHQHERIYNYDRQTQYGEFRDGPSEDTTLKFLEMAHFDQGGRIFTYVITLDGLLRFTETGKEFGIDLLSKHTMHSDVHIYIAWSGEFLIRRVAHPDQSPSDPDQHTHPAEDVPGGPPHSAPPKDPAHYELIIDNDSGTYRPNKKLIPVLKEFLEKNFPGLKVVVMACDDEKLSKIKEDQKKVKGKEGDNMVFGQQSSLNLNLGSDAGGGDGGSISSSDEEELEERARQAGDDGGEGVTGKLEKGFNAIENPKTAFGVVSGEAKGLGKKIGLGHEGGKKQREHAEEQDDQAS
ncbi:C2 domain-containing protein [Kwoniella heveanensis CBS 569]|nr:C2 domain-containing protein [Kwoniella heveanensis CBS 569]